MYPAQCVSTCYKNNQLVDNSIIVEKINKWTIVLDPCILMLQIAMKKYEKKSLSPQKSVKNFVENVGRKKIVVEIYEKYVDHKKHQMVTYIIGKAYGKKYI